MISTEYLEGVRAAGDVWPLHEGAVVINPYQGKGNRAESEFNVGFYETIKTLTVIDLMKKDKAVPPPPIIPYRGFKVGDGVRKVKGYAFPGEIVSLFTTTTGEERCVVELQAEGAGALLHIFNLEQIEHLKAPTSPVAPSWSVG